MRPCASVSYSASALFLIKYLKINYHMNKFSKRALIASFIAIAAVNSALSQIQWYNPMDAEVPYLSGRAWNEEIGNKSFGRMPERMQADMPSAVWSLSRNTAGVSVKFLSNTENVTVKYTLERMPGYVNMAKLDFAGVDLYGRDAHGEQYWIGNHMGWNFGDTITISYKNIKARDFASRGLEFELFLPPYSTVTSLQVGVDEGSRFRFLHESAERPIVVYGSSVVQGASPSRPGLMWVTQVKRDLDYPVVNLGFSGSAYMEPALFDAMAEIPARVYVLDPMPNSFKLDEGEIQRLIVAGVKTLRAQNDAPILLLDSPGAPDSVLHRDAGIAYNAGNAGFRKGYEELLAAGYDKLYYLSESEIGMDKDSYIEGSHPNDIGNRLQAQAVERKLREVLAEDAPNHRYAPIRQHRDGLYTWMDRHNEVIRLNHTIDPEVLCIGNSITHFWGGEPASHNNGGKTWDKLWGKRRAVNMGFGWDRIENVFWRIYHGEFEGCSPEHIFLLIGINNLANGDKEEDVARGIVDLAAAIHARQPQAKLHVIEIYPAKGREVQVERTNAFLRELLPTDDQVELISLSRALVLNDGSGNINPEMFIEGLHPNEKGYAALAKELKKQTGL